MCTCQHKASKDDRGSLLLNREGTDGLPRIPLRNPQALVILVFPVFFLKKTKEGGVCHVLFFRQLEIQRFLILAFFGLRAHPTVTAVNCHRHTVLGIQAT